MTIQEQIKEDIKTAMKAGDSDRLTVLRGINSAFNNKAIELRSSDKEMDDEAAMKVIASEAKKRKDSIEAFRSGGRDDLADKEAAELKILETYLPEQKSEAEIEAIVSRVLSENPEAKENMGQAMKFVMAEAGAGVDGKMVAQIVKKQLNG